MSSPTVQQVRSRLPPGELDRLDATVTEGHSDGVPRLAAGTLLLLASERPFGHHRLSEARTVDSDLRVGSTGRLLAPGECFDPRAERTYNFVVAGIAAVSPPPPAWWPTRTPSIPSTILGALSRGDSEAEAS